MNPRSKDDKAMDVVGKPKGKIIVVDDEEPVRTLLSEILSDEGLQCDGGRGR